MCCFCSFLCASSKQGGHLAGIVFFVLNFMSTLIYGERRIAGCEYHDKIYFIRVYLQKILKTFRPAADALSPCHRMNFKQLPTGLFLPVSLTMPFHQKGSYEPSLGHYMKTQDCLNIKTNIVNMLNSKEA